MLAASSSSSPLAALSSSLFSSFDYGISGLHFYTCCASVPNRKEPVFCLAASRIFLFRNTCLLPYPQEVGQVKTFVSAEWRESVESKNLAFVSLHVAMNA